MKKGDYIFVLLLVFGFIYDSNAQKTYVLLNELSTLNEYRSIFKEHPFSSNFSLNDSAIPAKLGVTKKKKKKTRGVETIRFSLNECSLLLPLISKELIFSSQAIYFHRFSSDNGERGPPIL